MDNKLIETIRKAATSDDHTALETALEKLTTAARTEGANDLLIDLHDAGEITGDGIEFAVENNGAADPRKR